MHYFCYNLYLSMRRMRCHRTQQTQMRRYNIRQFVVSKLSVCWKWKFRRRQLKVATLKRDVVATLWQHSANIVTTLQSNNSTNALQHLFNIVSTLPQPIFWYSLESHLHTDNRHFTIKSWALASLPWRPCKPI